MTNSFKDFHPVVNFYYFTVVIIFSMFFMHPIFLGISLISSFIYSVSLNGKKAVKFNLLYMLPLLIITAIMNPVFNHQGVTILFYLESGNPMTLESILYGVAAAVMFISVILWFSGYNAVMSSDKFIYLWGRIIPGTSLIISMVLRFVPRYKAQIKIISNGQKCIGRDVSNGNIIARARNGIKILSIMTTWALENAIETADSMKARGYGLKGRTSFSIFRFDRRDRITFLSMIGLTIIILLGSFLGENTIIYYPIIKIKAITVFSILVYIAYILLCMMPFIIDLKEEIKWRHLNLKE
ncbi:energy-coupling factor transporter transmembrane component T [Clostridium algidicarnis]|uniref:energy-coupling factor transporter transmembrane component T n=1 Tax=Clostridium algidicarnis TaxID=37659 RepID=UPI00049540A4|nr:energy-coupling factor transporter transmembrane component T [Clostridium algidicarnis]